MGIAPSSAQQARHAWGKQTVKAKPLVPEFKAFEHSQVELSQPGLRLLATPPTGAQHTELPNDSEEQQEHEQKRVRKILKYGIQWRPEEFLEEAKLLLHLKDPQKALPLVLKEAITQVMGRSPIEVAKHRLSVLLAIQRKSNELASEEKNLKDSMDPRTAAVLSNKRLCLWKYLLEVTGFADMEVVDLVTGYSSLWQSYQTT